MLHFASKVVTFRVNVTFCVNCYILRCNRGGSSATAMLAEGVDGDSLTETSDNEETNQRSEGTVIYYSRYFLKIIVAK